MHHLSRLGTRIAAAMGSAVLLTGLVATAHAQVQRIPARPGSGPNLDDARIIRSGALLIASFDANHDFVITDEEIEAGAQNTFLIADADGSGGVSPLEQRAWAARIGSENDVLANPSLFASMTPGHVTAEEFSAGLLIFADRFRGESGTIAFTDLTIQADEHRADQTPLPEDVARLGRPNIADRPDGGSR